MKSISVYIVGSLTVLLLVLFLSCKSKQKVQLVKEVLTEAEIKELPKILSYSKSACYGYCPVFKMVIYQDGWTIFEGKQHTAKEGMAIVQLNPDTLKTLLQHCQAADIWSCEKAYGMRIQDLPVTTVHIYEAQKDKSVQWKMRQPQRLKTLDNQLMELVANQGWVAPRENKKTSKREAMPDVKIANEIIVQFKNDLDAIEWTQAYQQYGMNLKKPISKIAHMHLFIFDSKSIDSEKMLALIKADEQVENAEFNKRMQSRTR